MINCYLKTSKSAMYFSPFKNIKICDVFFHSFPVSFQPLEKPLRQTSCYKSIFGCQYQLLEDRKYKAQRNH